VKTPLATRLPPLMVYCWKTPPAQVLVPAVKIVVPLPDWLINPAPETVTVTVSVWLKLTVAVPNPKLITGGRKFPAVSLPPEEPKFRLPEEPACEAMVTASAENDPPLATVRVPPPASPIVRSPLMFHADPLPVTSTLLFVEEALKPMTPP